MSNLLQGVRVVESATLFNGDRLGMLLGDLGADVIKVESPFQGDYLRDFLGQITPHHSPAHIQVNKHKRSLTVDLRTERGTEVFWKLLATADVFVDGNASDACTRLGIGYEAQRSHKPDIVYCQYSGFGSTGPYAAIPTHGQMMNSLAGATPMEMGEDGLTRPAKPSGQPMVNTSTGGEGTATGAIYAAYYVAAALWSRDRTGQGCFIDASAADAVITNGWIGMTYALNIGRVTDASSMPASADAPSAKYQFYETKDRRFILFCCIEPKFWKHFCAAIERDDLVGHVDSSHPVDFGRGDTALRLELQTIFHTRTQAEWVELARAHDIAMGPAVKDVEELRSDPHLASRHIFYESTHPQAGPFTYLGEPAIVSGQDYQVRQHAPWLGEQTDELLTELGYGPSEVEDMRGAGVV
jgi:crotonobetainyl-CoA:carnitine CoA-transferase CaiB-like acyl-CoA transferase